MTCSSKIVVFDLDETLGYFMELGMFWGPNIKGILNYLKHKKEKNHCDKLMIYTNNQGPIEWAKFIMNYFENKIDYKIFDQIIGAFKIQGKRVELCRTTHMKTHNDFIKCTKVPENTQICFLDDVFYPGMSNEKIYYINIKPYIHDLDFNEMITRFLESDLEIKIEDQLYFRDYILTFMKKYNYIYIKKNIEVQNIDVILSKKILQHLHLFFKMKPIGSNNKTHRIIKRYKKLNKTLKNM